MIVGDDGSTRFEPEAGGAHRHLVLDAERRGDVTAMLVELASQPPDGVGR